MGSEMCIRDSRNTVEGIKIKNIQALINPNILNEFKNLDELKTP